MSFAAPADLSGRYVAIGDSYTSAPGVLPSKDLTLCWRSARNYPTLVSQGLRSSEFADASCGGAKTDDVFNTQFIGVFPANEPQIKRVTPGTKLVTVSLGGNDINFAEIMTTCNLAAANLLSPSCEQRFTPSGRDVLRDRIAATAPKIAKVLSSIKGIARDAKVVVGGYPTILPASGTPCYVTATMRDSDAYYVNRTFVALNKMLEDEAHKAGAQFVETARGSVGHDMCQWPGTRWFEPLISAGTAVFWHPNAEGQAFVARRILNDLGSRSG